MTGTTVVIWLFWISLLIVIYTYFLFPLILALRALFCRKPIGTKDHTPKVSLIIVAYNEAAVIEKKLDNVFSLNYPSEMLEVIVASDGSDDGTNELVKDYGAPRLKLLELPRQGKNRALNAAVQHAEGEILVFTDADSILAPDSLRNLLAPLASPDVGGVSGDYRYPRDISRNSGESSYWGYDRNLKRFQSLSGSITSVTGALYAIYRCLFRQVPNGVTDDFFVCSQVPSAHRRLIFEPKAVAYGPISESMEAEFLRKVRVVTRGLRSVWKMRHLLNPFRYGFYSLQLFTHKVLRRLMVIPLFILSVCAPVLWSAGYFYTLMTILQIGFVSAAILGFLLRRRRIGRLKPFALASFFVMVNTATALALLNLVRGLDYDVWAPRRTPLPSGNIAQ
jgi:cellulose synthase/poly-beta-1,6-N-acetylglucosamine synthase-like glycosyltransferase